MISRWIPVVVVLTAVAAAGAVAGMRWPTMLAGLAVLLVLALRPVAGRPARLLTWGGLLAVAGALVAEVSAWRQVPVATADLIAMITDPVLQREQTIRSVVVAGALVLGCVLLAVAVIRLADPGVLPDAVAPLVIGTAVLGARTWMEVQTAYRTITTAPPLASPSQGERVSIAVSVDDGPYYESGFIIAGTLVGVALLVVGCVRLSRREPAA
ncbi:hypothetical protein AB0F81_29875 [Actinoplanes sp. NPDC024001]|uniref:hypothetical protein n=1 Tax=Actinoplanes sp. NPDC024001 TaxID=3154598 RepID=UPI0033CB1B54